MTEAEIYVECSRCGAKQYVPSNAVLWICQNCGRIHILDPQKAKEVKPHHRLPDGLLIAL